MEFDNELAREHVDRERRLLKGLPVGPPPPTQKCKSRLLPRCPEGWYCEHPTGSADCEGFQPGSYGCVWNRPYDKVEVEEEAQPKRQGGRELPRPVRE